MNRYKNMVSILSKKLTRKEFLRLAVLVDEDSDRDFSEELSKKAAELDPDNYTISTQTIEIKFLKRRRSK